MSHSVHPSTSYLLLCLHYLFEFTEALYEEDLPQLDNLLEENRGLVNERLHDDEDTFPLILLHAFILLTLTPSPTGMYSSGRAGFLTTQCGWSGGAAASLAPLAADWLTSWLAPVRAERCRPPVGGPCIGLPLGWCTRYSHWDNSDGTWNNRAGQGQLRRSTMDLTY